MFSVVASQGMTLAVVDTEASTFSNKKTAAQTELASNLSERTIVEQSVRSYFSDIPELIEIARCESTFRHLDEKGNLLRGVHNPDDVGVMQINEYYHGEVADRLGYDITSLDGNMAFARRLYTVYGTDPWSASSKCWKKPVLALKK